MIGDVNYQPKHSDRRKAGLEALCGKFGLTRRVPKETTYFGHNGDRSTIDQALTSSGLGNVRYRVVGWDELPGNMSTHSPVLWSMTFKEGRKETKKVETEDTDNKLFRRLPRVDWTNGIDLDLYKKKVDAYLRVAVKICRTLPPAWRMSVMQDLMADAADTARVRYLKEAEEIEDDIVIKDQEKRISDLWRDIKRKRVGYFPSKRYMSVRQLLDGFPDKKKKVLEIAKLEVEHKKMKAELRRTMVAMMDEEQEEENEELIIALAEGRSRDFYSGVKNIKKVKNDTPNEMFYDDRWYYGQDVLTAFVKAAEDQSGESRNIPGLKCERRYVWRKEIVTMRTIIAKSDKTKFKQLDNKGFLKLIKRIKLNKSPDIYCNQIENVRYLGDSSYEQFRCVFNEILVDIVQYRHPLLSIAKACMLWKGRNKPKNMIKGFRRVQICTIPQKLVQELFCEQAKEAVKEHKLDTQFGFSENISFLQSSVARECISKFSVDKGDQVFLIAADVESAFSKTDRICQLSELGGQGEFGELFLFSVSFFENTNMVMKSGGKFSTVFQETQGAPQGSKQGPNLFCQYKVPLDRYLKQENIGYSVAGKRRRPP